jgi:hypothetical protein
MSSLPKAESFNEKYDGLPQGSAFEAINSTDLK